MSRRIPSRPEGVPESYKRCGHCKEWKERIFFSKNSSSKDGLSPRCKECHRLMLGITSHVAGRPQDDLTGKRFGRLVVTEQITSESKSRSIWRCLCDCGNTHQTRKYNLDSGHTTSCGCWKIESIASRFVKTDAAFNQLWSWYTKHAENRNLSFDLSRDQFKEITQKNCFYCGDPPSRKIKRKISSCVYNGVDRVDNTIGYSVDNCVSCCFMCNHSKSDYTKEEFISWIKRVYEHLEKNNVNV